VLEPKERPDTVVVPDRSEPEPLVTEDDVDPVATDPGTDIKKGFLG
jgi:hypothetical protein